MSTSSNSHTAPNLNSSNPANSEGLHTGMEVEFAGDERRCFCGLTPRAVYAFIVFNTGRQFLKCPRPAAHQCRYFDWLDVTQTAKEIEFGKIVYKRFARHEEQMQEKAKRLVAMCQNLTDELEKLTAENNELQKNIPKGNDVQKLVEENTKLKLTIKIMEELNQKKSSSPLFGICVAVIICLAWILSRD